jgi:hypothetical protein
MKSYSQFVQDGIQEGIFDFIKNPKVDPETREKVRQAYLRKLEGDLAQAADVPGKFKQPKGAPQYKKARPLKNIHKTA